MEEGRLALSEVTHFNKYAKYLHDKNRRETYEETVDRYLQMMVKRYPDLESDIISNGQLIKDRKVLPSMRAMQFAGQAVEKNESRVYNCAFLPIDDYRAFAETMFLLLGGTGVGFSVQNHHIEKLPNIRKPLSNQRFLIEDSIEGWADAVKHLMKAYFGKRETKPRFDFSAIRAKGERLVTAGGKAPGPAPLKECLVKIESILESKEDGSKLTSIEVHDICCHIADAVLAGGIRRAAMISLFSADDLSMLTCKSGNWWETNPQRGRANNSAVVLRHRATEEFFKTLWKRVEDSGAGEPGVYLSNNADWGTNPCCEIALRPFQFCNLTEINGSNIESQDDFNHRAYVTAFFGTLQAGFTDFHYLRPIWKKTTEKDALTGVGITGIATTSLLDLNEKEAAMHAINGNKETAERIKINSAARITTVKPSGTTSCILGTSSGIHAWHSKYYTRNIQCNAGQVPAKPMDMSTEQYLNEVVPNVQLREGGDDLFKYFRDNHPELIKIMEYSAESAVVGIPIKAPEGALTRGIETSMDFLKRVARFNQNWVRVGHVGGDNTNNVSATISIKPEEWESVGNWMWENRHTFNGLSALPYDGGTYKDAPFEEIDEKLYKEKISYVSSINMSNIEEKEDNTDLKGELACAGGNCELT